MKIDVHDPCYDIEITSYANMVTITSS